jgi:hypothetical protein
MITKTELYFAYQKETGLGFEHIQKVVLSDQVETDHITQCSQCDHEWEETVGAKLEPDIFRYIDWLENLILTAANAGKLEL